MKKLPRNRGVLFLSLVLAAFQLFAHVNSTSAQGSASISGRVLDSSDAVVAGTEVTVTNLETMASRSTPVDASGNYLILSLPIGRYEVKAAATGFKTGVTTGIGLVVGQQAVVNLKLEVGEVQQAVTVTADAPVVNTTTASVAGLVGEQEVKDLPLNGRSFDNLITLNTGAISYTAYTGNAAVGSGAGNSFSVVGRRTEDNLFLLNGVEYTGEGNRSNLPSGASGQLLGIDAVREFNVLTDTYSAEYGKRPGAQVNIVTQSGTNQFHGSLFEFMRNSAMDARNFFDAPTSQIGHRIPVFQRNQFGGAAGGPIKKDKAFIFGNYEGFRQRLGVADVAIVPDANARQGILPCGVIAPTPSSCAGVNANPTTLAVPLPVPNVKSGMLPYFALWPTANGPVLGAGLAYSYNTPKQSIREDFATLRMDQNLSSKDMLSEVYTFDDGINFTPQVDPVFTGVYKIRDQVGSIEEVHIFTPNTINTFRFGYSRGAFNFNVPPAIPLPANLSLFSGLVPGQITIGGGTASSTGTLTLSSPGSSADYLVGARNLFTYTDNVQLIKGIHHISAGVWFQRMQDNRGAATRKAGQATFSTLETFLQGTVSNLQGVIDPHEQGYRLWEGAWYVEDTIRLRSNLTLNIGLRHEFTTRLSEAHGRIANTALGSDLIPVTAPLIGNIFPKNDAKWLFGPRVGLAWDVFGNGKTAVRSGFATAYSMPDNYLYTFDVVAPFNSSIVFGQNAPFLSLVPIQTGPSSIPACGPTVVGSCFLAAQKGIQSNRAPTVQEWNLAIEQQIMANTSLRVAYVGSHGYYLPFTDPYNTVVPQICSNPSGCVSGGLNSAHGNVQPGTLYVPVATQLPNPYLATGDFLEPFNSNYNALQVDVKRRIGKGLQFRGNYTWSKSLNIAAEPGQTESQNSQPQLLSPYTALADWGPSSENATHAASISGSYELPIGRGKPWLSDVTGAKDKLLSGWQVNSIVTILSGFPFNPVIGANTSGNGNKTNPDRPSWNPNFTGPVIIGSPNKWYDPTAFIIPVSGTFGNVGKGVLRGPGLTNWDMSVFKITTLTERLKLEFRAEGFNILNHANFSFPNQTVFSGSSVSPSAGIITKTTTTSRQIQMGLKLIF